MRTYETTFIINPQTDDATIERHISDIADIITKNNGKIVHEDKMGTRRLAYPIQKLTQGYYASFIFEAPREVLPLLDRHYKLNEMYIRNLTVRFDGKLEEIIQQENPFVKPNANKFVSDKEALKAKTEVETKKEEKTSPPPENREEPVQETPVVEPLPEDNQEKAEKTKENVEEKGESQETPETNYDDEEDQL
ncbi:MAG: 30S ribosomal protein S6 [FCB group bacterium]|nr:30S ribosomal protein S6 [FCB group bacterium]